MRHLVADKLVERFLRMKLYAIEGVSQMLNAGHKFQAIHVMIEGHDAPRVVQFGHGEALLRVAVAMIIIGDILLAQLPDELLAGAGKQTTLSVV